MNYRYLLMFLLFLSFNVFSSDTCTSCQQCQQYINSGKDIEIVNNLEVNNTCIEINSSNAKNHQVSCNQNIMITGKGGVAFSIKNVTGVTISGCRFNGAFSKAILADNANQLQLSQLYFDLSSFSSLIYLNNTDNAIVNNIQATGTISGGKSVFYLNSVSNSTFNLINTTFSASYGHLFHLENSNQNTISSINFKRIGSVFALKDSNLNVFNEIHGGVSSPYRAIANLFYTYQSTSNNNNIIKNVNLIDPSYVFYSRGVDSSNQFLNIQVNTTTSRTRFFDIYAGQNFSFINISVFGKGFKQYAYDFVYCNHHFENITLPDNTTFYFFNTPHVVRNNLTNVGEIVLCGADNSYISDVNFSLQYFPHIKIFASDNVTIRNVTINNSYNSINAYRSSNIYLYNLNISNDEQYGVYFRYNHQNAAIFNSTIVNSSVRDIYFNGGSCAGTMENVTVTDGKLYFFTSSDNNKVIRNISDASLIIICEVENLTLDNISLNGSGSFRNNGISVTSVKSLNLFNVYINNKRGISGTYNQHTTIINATIINSSSNGIYWTAGWPTDKKAAIRLKNIKIDHCFDSSGNSKDALLFSRVDGVIADNISINSALAGITFSSYGLAHHSLSLSNVKINNTRDGIIFSVASSSDSGFRYVNSNFTNISIYNTRFDAIGFYPILTDTPEPYLIKNSSFKNIYIKNAGIGIFGVDLSENNSFDNITIENIHSFSSHDFKYLDTSDVNSAVAIHLRNEHSHNNSNFVFSNIKIINSSGAGFYITNANNTIRDKLVNISISDTPFAVYIKDEPKISISNLNITNSTKAFYVNGNFDSSVENVFIKNSEIGVEINNSNANGQFSNLIIRNTSKKAVSLISTLGFVLTNFNISEPGEYGIYGDSSSSIAFYKSDTFPYNYISGASKYDLFFLGTIRNPFSTIRTGQTKDRYIYINPPATSSLDNASLLIITRSTTLSNFVVNNTRHNNGILIIGANGVNLENISVYNSYTGLNLINSQDNSFVNLTLKNNSFGINLTNSPNNYFDSCKNELDSQTSMFSSNSAQNLSSRFNIGWWPFYIQNGSSSINGANTELYEGAIGDYWYLGFCPCNSCDTCSIMSSDTRCIVTKMVQNVSANKSDKCIFSNTPKSNSYFDCDGFSLISNSTGHAFYLSNLNNFSIQNCNLYNFSQRIPLAIFSSSNISIYNTSFNSNSAGDIYLSNVNQGDITNVSFTNSSNPFYLYSTSNVRIHDIDNLTSYQKIVYLNLASNNTFENLSSPINKGTYSFYLTNSLNNLFTNVHLNNSYYGIYVIGSSSANNTITNSSINNATYGISISNDVQVNVYNTSISNSQTGIFFSGKNSIFENVSLFNNTNAIEFVSSSVSSNLTNSRITGSYQAISLDGSSNNLYNIHINNSEKGLLLSGRSCSISNISFTNISNYAINLKMQLPIWPSSISNISILNANTGILSNNLYYYGKYSIKNIQCTNCTYGVKAVDSFQDISISNMTISDSQTAVYLSNSSEINMSNINSNHNQKNFVITKSSDISLANLTSNSGDYGLLLNNTKSIVISDSTLSNNGSSQVVYLYDSTNNTLNNVSAISGLYGFYIYSSSSRISAQNNSFIGCVADSNTQYGFYLYNSGDNYFKNCSNEYTKESSQTSYFSSNSAQLTTSTGNKGWWPRPNQDGGNSINGQLTTYYHGGADSWFVQDCTCIDCQTCTDQLNDEACKRVVLGQDISGIREICINDPVNITNKTFICKDTITIAASSSETVPAAIYLNSKSGVNIESCTIRGFETGIKLENSNNITIDSVEIVSSKKYGILLNNSDSNTFKFSTIQDTDTTSDNSYGIYLENSELNYFISCDNEHSSLKPMFYSDKPQDATSSQNIGWWPMHGDDGRRADNSSNLYRYPGGVDTWFYKVEYGGIDDNFCCCSCNC